MLTDVGRIVAVPKAVPRTRGLSRHWSPPVGGTRPNSSYAYQCLAAPACVSGLELVAGVSVAVSAEILVIGGPGPCHVEQDQHKICAGNGSEDRGDPSYQSYATSPAAKSSKGPTHDH
jgi:hypothetical protein